MDIAAAINAELLDLQAAGCDMFQLDEPAMTRYHDKVMAYGAGALDRCLEGVTVPTLVHLCYGYPGGAGMQHHYTYPELLDRLMQTRISGFTVEFARSDYDPAILKPYRDRLIVYGCIDPGNTPAPSVDAVKRRIAKALEYLDPHRVLLAPDCGLMTISRDLARQKLQSDGRGGAGFAAGIVAIEGKGLFETCGLRVAGLAALLLIVGGAHTSLADDVADFYHGRQMTFVIGSSVGGGYDAYGRLLARFLPKHIPGNPTAVPQNVPGAGSRSASNSLYNVVPKDGSVLGVISQSAPLDQAMRQKGIQFDAGRFELDRKSHRRQSGYNRLDQFRNCHDGRSYQGRRRRLRRDRGQHQSGLLSEDHQSAHRIEHPSRERLSRGSGYSAGDGAR